MKQKITSVIVLIVVAFLVFGHEVILEKITGKAKDPNIQIEKVRQYSINRTQTSSYRNVFALEDRIAFYSNAKLNCVDLEGNALWDRKMSEDLILDQSRNDLLVVEKQKGNIYQIDNEGEIVRSLIGIGNVLDAKSYQDGSISIRLNDNKTLLYYDQAMKQRASIQVQEGTIIASSLNIDSQKVAILVLNEKKGKIQSDIYLYDLDGKFIEKTTVERLILDIFVTTTEVIIVGSEDVTSYDFEFNRTSQEIFNSIQKIERIDDHLLLINQVQEGSDVTKNELISYDLLEKKNDFSRTIAKEYDKIIYNDGVYLAFKETTMDLLNQSAAYIFRGEHAKIIEKAFILSNRNIILVDEDSIILYRLVY